MMLILTIRMYQIISLGPRLDSLRATIMERCAEIIDQIPSSEGISLEKLKEAGLMSDTCHEANLTKLLISGKVVGDTVELDCMQHIWCIHWKACEKACTERLNVSLRDSLDTIASELRVTCSFTGAARVYDKAYTVSRATTQRAKENTLRLGSGRTDRVSSYIMYGVLLAPDTISVSWWLQFFT